ncbi:hypothetical protein [Natrinema pallidum]|uniref:Head-tail adaptor protein n=1 Tax=Natrinema pallidum TaxID=69527 RepID=A0A4P9TFU4_9EURY|nr:hypothetical protein [Natrinema pallidum]QCW03567.1 hypothetical protein FGF80_10085 [Natrinema pallidum]
MRHRLETGLTDRVDIYRREKVDENEIGERIYGWAPVASDVPCQFDDESTEYVRGDTGEEVRTPATATFDGAISLEEGDRLEFSAGWHEVTGIDETVDHRRGTAVSVDAELQESDPLADADIVGGS